MEDSRVAGRGRREMKALRGLLALGTLFSFTCGANPDGGLAPAKDAGTPQEELDPRRTNSDGSQPTDAVSPNDLGVPANERVYDGSVSPEADNGGVPVDDSGSLDVESPADSDTFEDSAEHVSLATACPALPAPCSLRHLLVFDQTTGVAPAYWVPLTWEVMDPSTLRVMGAFIPASPCGRPDVIPPGFLTVEVATSPPSISVVQFEADYSSVYEVYTEHRVSDPDFNDLLATASLGQLEVELYAGGADLTLPLPALSGAIVVASKDAGDAGWAIDIPISVCALSLAAAEEHPCNCPVPPQYTGLPKLPLDDDWGFNLGYIYLEIDGVGHLYLDKVGDRIEAICCKPSDGADHHTVFVWPGTGDLSVDWTTFLLKFPTGEIGEPILLIGGPSDDWATFEHFDGRHVTSIGQFDYYKNPTKTQWVNDVNLQDSAVWLEVTVTNLNSKFMEVEFEGLLPKTSAWTGATVLTGDFAHVTNGKLRAYFKP